MENRLDKTSSRCWDCSWLNIFFSLIIIGSLFPAIYVDQQVFIITGVAYFLLFIETLCSQTRSFLANAMKANDLTVYLLTLGAAAPHIKFWIQNYHMEQRSSTDSKGNTHTYTVRVNTHFACEYFTWGDCVDKSPEPDSVEVIKQFRLTRVENGIKVMFTPGARASFNDQEADFKRRNIRDTHWDYNVLNELPGHTENILLHNMDSNPWYASSGWYWAFSFFMMGWLYRILFILNSQKVTFDFTKIILK